MNSSGEKYFTCILEELIGEIFCKLKMGRADWDLNHVLMNELGDLSKRKVIEEELRAYAKNVNSANKLKIKLKKKYYLLSSLWQLSNHPESS